MKINEIFEKNDKSARYEYDKFIWQINLEGEELINERCDIFTDIYSIKELLECEFTEIEREIDWTKIPKWTKVNVRDYEDEQWRNSYLLEYDNEVEGEFKFHCTSDSEFTYKSFENNEWYINCRIDKSVTPKEEWYK